MVFLVDFDDEAAPDPDKLSATELAHRPRPKRSPNETSPSDQETAPTLQDGPEGSSCGCINEPLGITNDGAPALLAEALGCYPIVTLLTSYIDLNTLHALSRTCHQVRANLVQYRSRLIRQTLRCSNEIYDQTVLTTAQTGVQRWHVLGESGHLSSGKVSSCARDLVRDCRRCGKIVCRNCTIKPPATSRFPLRLRRLCPVCISAPLECLTRNKALSPSDSYFSPTSASFDALHLAKSSPAHTPSSPSTDMVHDSFMNPALQDSCNCASFGVHICVACGARLAEADTTHKRVWTWRTRYTTYLGGVGTGVGEGNEGVKCARGADCLGAVEVEVEFECPSSKAFNRESNSGSSEDITTTTTDLHGATNGSTPLHLQYNDHLPVDIYSDQGTLHPSGPSTPASFGSHLAAAWLSPDDGEDSGSRSTPITEKDEAGYWQQEVEGLGGVVKKKFRKRERVGATVREWEDESRGGEILHREKSGVDRSWCSWCARVVLPDADAVEHAALAEQSSSSSVRRIVYSQLLEQRDTKA